MAKRKVSKGLDVRVEYAKCMILGFSIRKSAITCEISVKTSFYMRHRILDAIRKSRKRVKEVKKRGISSEQICISTAIDRSNIIAMEMFTKGRMKTSDLERLHVGRLDTESVICTDSHKS